MTPDRSDQLLPLTTAQRGLWMGSRLAPKGATFNIAEAVEITGEIKPDLFVRALNQLSIEAETTRIRIVMTPQGPMQYVEPSVRMVFPVVDFTAEADPDAAALAWMRERILRSVDLERDPLWFNALIQLAPERALWFHCCHHIVLDGFTAGMIAQRLMALYNAYIEGRSPEPHGFLPFSTLIEQEQLYRASERRETDRSYWLEHLRDAPDAPTLSLRPDRRNSGAHGGFIRRSWTIPPHMVDRLTMLARDHAATLPQALTALLAGYLFRMTGLEDIVVGMPLTGRGNRTMRQVPGLAANAVALRFRPNRLSNFPDLLQQARRALQGALRHQQFRYEDLRRELGFHEIDRHIARFSVNIEPFDYALRFGEAPARSHNLSNGTMEDLTIFVFDRQDGKGLRMDFDANPSLYTPDELDAHLARVERLLLAVLDAPNEPLAVHNLIDDEERAAWRLQANNAVRLWPEEGLTSLIRERASDTPETVAVIDCSGSLSYRELVADVDALCGALKQAGISPGHLVAVMLPRDRRAVTTLLAIAQSGAAWLPLHGDGPAERRLAILDDAKPALIVTCGDYSADLPLELPSLLLETGVEPVMTGGGVENTPARVPPATAYVTYTSGTTGRPKGVVVPHSALKNLLLSMREILSFDQRERLLAVTTLTFDIAVLEQLLPLLSGATLIVATREEVQEPRRLAAVIRRHGATALQATPTMWQAILAAGQDDALRGLLLLTGGEALQAQLAERLFRLARAVFNLYGPTETTIWSTTHRLSAADLAQPPIGSPIANTRLHILDPHGAELPDGVVGELAIGGDGVAFGYLDRPELTAERFVADRGVPGARLYRTGDRAVRDARGIVTALGRNDDQLKIKGVRVEPAEIESALLTLPGIAQAGVVAQQEPSGVPFLAAYLVASDPHRQTDGAELRRALAGKLLPQMIPARFHYLDALPRTPSGKLDRRALPRPEPEAVKDGAAFVAPRTPAERMMAEIWKSVLGIDKVGIHDNFFDLGGDSLNALRLVTALQELGLELPLGDLFTEPTIAGLAPLFDGTIERQDPLAPLLPIRAAGDAAPLFCLHPVLGVGWSFTTLAAHLPQRHPVYALQDISLLSGDGEPLSVEVLVDIYLRHIRSVQPHGPYHLIGWSMGGLVAHGIASRLRREGETIGLLALLDSYPFLGTLTSPDAREEAMLVRAAMDFLQMLPDAEGGIPETVDALADHIAAAIDLGSLPPALAGLGTVPEFLARLRATTQHNLDLARRYTLGHADADALFFRAAARGGAGADAVIHDTPEVWRSHLGGKLTIHEIDCRHQDMLLPAHAGTLGALIARHLDRMASRPVLAMDDGHVALPLSA